MAFVITAITAEVVTLATVAAAVSELGIALSVVGAVTGSKELVKIGGVLGLAGGVGSLASAGIAAASGAGIDGLASAGASDVAGAAASNVGTTAAADAATSSATSAATSGADSAAFSAMDASQGIIGNAAASGAQALPGTLADAVAPAATDAASAGGSAMGADPNAVTGAATAPTNASPSVATPDATGVSTPDGSVATPSSDGSMGAQGSDGAALHSDAGYGAIPTTPNGSTLGAIKDWWNNLPVATQQSYLKVGSSAVGGLFNGWSEEQKLALEKNKFALTQKQYDTSMANANAIPAINFKAITPTPSPAPQPGGIINTARAS